MSSIDSHKLQELNDKIYENACVDREHLLKFLTLVDTNEAKVIIEEVQKWLKSLHDDPKFSKIVFPGGDIDAIIGDLDSYGRVKTETIMEFKDTSNRNLKSS